MRGLGEHGGGGGRGQLCSGHLREGTGSVTPGLLAVLPRLVVSRACHHPHSWPGGSCEKGASFAGAQARPAGLEVHREGGEGWLHGLEKPRFVGLAVGGPACQL